MRLSGCPALAACVYQCSACVCVQARGRDTRSLQLQAPSLQLQAPSLQLLMCIDMCVEMCIDMRVDMCMPTRVGVFGEGPDAGRAAHAHRHRRDAEEHKQRAVREFRDRGVECCEVAVPTPMATRVDHRRRIR